jgi:hypothetical protein
MLQISMSVRTTPLIFAMEGTDHTHQWHWQSPENVAIQQTHLLDILAWFSEQEKLHDKQEKMKCSIE